MHFFEPISNEILLAQDSTKYFQANIVSHSSNYSPYQGPSLVVGFRWMGMWMNTAVKSAEKHVLIYDYRKNFQVCSTNYSEN
jgi:hypothetical protein